MRSWVPLVLTKLHRSPWDGFPRRWSKVNNLLLSKFSTVSGNCVYKYILFVLKQHLRKNSQTLGWSTNLNLCCVFIVLLRLYLNEEKIYISQWTNHLILNSYAKLVYDKFHRQSLFEYFPVLLILIIYVFIYKYICMCVWVNFLSGAVMVVIVW
jgi:hypothetical protein